MPKTDLDQVRLYLFINNDDFQFYLKNPVHTNYKYKFLQIHITYIHKLPGKAFSDLVIILINMHSAAHTITFNNAYCRMTDPVFTHQINTFFVPLLLQFNRNYM